MNVAELLKFSLYLQREFNRNESVFDNADIGRCYAVGELVDSIAVEVVSCRDLEELNKLLRVIRNREMVRIAVRDLCGVSEVVETIGDLSDLARGLVSASLDWHYIRACEKFGVPMGELSNEPQKMLVIGMGKLGGRELNFSSDIDLIFAYPERGYAVCERGRETSNNQFFIRLGQALNKSLGEVTGDGFVYRVDMRLRPFGNTGSLAVSFAELENYYALHGRAWERYALVKARVLAGDVEKGRELFDILRPFVYRKYIDFSSLDSLRELKMMIHAEVVKKEMFANIKLGRGGIREVEFIVQAFQLINGGRSRDLQSRSLLKTLRVCVDKNYLTRDEGEGLRTAYLFLRKTENRLQEWNDQQTHDLPSSKEQQLMLALSLGFACYDDFMVVLDRHRNFVQAQFDLTFTDSNDNEVEEVFVADPFLEKLGFKQPRLAMAKLDSFKELATYRRASTDSIERFEQVLPNVLVEIAGSSNQLETLDRILSLFEKILQRSVYLVLLIENRAAIVNLVLLCSMSQWLTDRLIKSPALFDQLLDGDILFEPLEVEQLQAEVALIREDCQGDDESFMNRLREWRGSQIFKVAASDVTGNLPVMKVSDYLTWIAEAVLNAVSEYAWQVMVAKNGQPLGIDCSRRPLLVLGYGKMGGLELGYGSDLDIVFLYHGLDRFGKTDGKNPVDIGLFMTRLTQKIILLMTTTMPTGRLYEVDTRLRPNGASGLIVSDFEGFVRYQQEKAWTWEHQALVRARAVVFDEQGEQAFKQFKHNFILEPKDFGKLKDEVVEMRLKMRESLDKSDANLFDLKQGVGGIVDIEFMVQYWVLAYANQYPELVEYSDNIRLLETIKKCSFLVEISVQEIEKLKEIYCDYRGLYHRLALQNVNAKVKYKMVNSNREVVEKVWNKLFP